MSKKYHLAHIIIDEKFIDDTIDIFDLYSDKWDSDWIISSRISENLKYIKRYSNRIHIIPESELNTYIVRNNFDAVVLHNLQVISPKTILNIPSNIKLFWFCWGFELCNFPINRPLVKWKLYKPLTSKYHQSSLSIRLYELKIKVKYTLKRYGKKYREVLSRVDFFSGYPFEYELLNKLPEFKAQKVRHTYPNLTTLKSSDKYNGINILIGNSAALTNNHLDCLEYLKQVDIKDRKIVIPMSYGQTSNYVEVVGKAYREVFGTKVELLINFIPYNEYKEIIQSCGIAIFYMTRQQAMGNIKAALKLGCKVFLSEDNPIYSYFKKLGLFIYSVEHDLNDNNINTPLTDSEIDNNRKILEDLYGYNACLRNLDSIYNALS